MCIISKPRMFACFAVRDDRTRLKKRRRCRHLKLRHTRISFQHSMHSSLYTLSLHDALPISTPPVAAPRPRQTPGAAPGASFRPDRKSTRLNSSHRTISYAVFCLKKKITDVYHFKAENVRVLRSQGRSDAVEKKAALPASEIASYENFISAFNALVALHSFPTRRSSDLNSAGGSAATSTNARSCSWSLFSTRSEEHTSELQSPYDLVCRLLLEKKNYGCVSFQSRECSRASQSGTIGRG